MTLRAAVSLLACVLPLPACAEEMPAQRPADARFVYSFDGGMRPTYRWLEIVGDKGHIRGRQRRQKFEIRFTVPTAMLDRLWRAFRDNRFTEIETRDGGKVYDRGGVTLRLGWAGKSVRVANSGNIFVEKRWWKQFGAIRSAMEAVLNAELAKRDLPKKQ